MTDSRKEHAVATIKEAIAEAAKEYPGGFIPRTKVPFFTGGLYSAGYLANCDSRGDGVKGSFRIGRQRVYPLSALADWLIERVEV